MCTAFEVSPARLRRFSTRARRAKLWGLVTTTVTMLIQASQAGEPASSSHPSDSSSATAARPQGAAALGQALFGRNCAHCHGDDARGDEGPSLYELKKSDDRIRQIIQQGIKGEMPRFITKFNEAELRALIAYLRTLKNLFHGQQEPEIHL